MSNTKEPSHFLDKETFLALAVIFGCWILWERHIKEKYPPSAAPPVVQESQEEALRPEKTPKQNLFAEKNAEKAAVFFHFEDEARRFEFSSRGMGIKKAVLKKFFDREKNIIEFKAQKLFFEIQEGGRPLFFKVKKKSKNRWEGRAPSPGGLIQASIHVQKSFIEYEIFQKKWSQIELLTLQKPIKGAEGLIQMWMTGAEPGLGLFVKNQKQIKRIFHQGEGEDPLQMAGVEVLGLGQRYFGGAFSNDSDIRPELFFQGDESLWKTKLLYNIPQKGQIPSLKYKIYFGPKASENLKQVDSRLVAWIDFGFFESLAKGILFFLRWTHSLIKNWGVSIILLTLLVRLLLFPLNLSAYRSMKIMKKIQPEMKAIRSKYKGGDARKMNEEVLALMRKNKAQPLGGCLPMLVQLPIFFALFRVLRESFELYQAPFFGWIQDLSSKDPFYALPVLMGVAMYFQQKITPTNLEPAQEKVLKMLPFIFAVSMIALPSGLTLYIFVTTLFGFAQQYYFLREDNKSDLEAKT